MTRINMKVGILHRHPLRRQVIQSALLGLGMLSLVGCGGGGSVGDKLGLGLNSIGTTPPPSTSTPFVALAQYVGTWAGTWQDPYPTNTFGLTGQRLGQVGTLSVTVGADGHVTGQVVDTTTGQTGTLTEDIMVTNGQTQGYVENVSCTLGGTTLAEGSTLPVDAQGHWLTVFAIPPLPSEIVGSSNVTRLNATSTDLAKQ